MADKQTIYVAEPIERASALNGGGRNLSHRLNQMADRYAELLADAGLPPLSDGEWNLIRDAMNGTVNEPATMIRQVWQGVEDAIQLDGLDAKWSVDGEALVATLRGLTYAQEVAVVEAVEAWWAGQ